MGKNESEVHSLNINGFHFRITSDPWTGDWAVEKLGDEYPQPYYLKTKEGAINYCLVEGSVLKRSEVEYEQAPDRTF